MRTVATLAAAGIAVIAGFFILRSVTDEPDESDSRAPTAATTSEPVSTTSLPSTTTTTTTTAPSTTTTIAPSVSKSEATVVVANASGVDGSATAMTEDLDDAGYTTGEVSNSTGSPVNQSIIYYIEGNPTSLGVAQLLAEQIPTARTVRMPQPPPIDRPLSGATVVLMLGRDAAGRPLDELEAE
jgi:LytR cell envelope-related transcriptional attenuator